MDTNKVLRSFFNKSKVTKAINYLNDYKESGLEDLETYSDRIVVSPDKVQTAIEMFEEYKDERKGGYLANILQDAFFTGRELRVIAYHLS